MADSPLVLAHLRNARKSYGKLLALDDMDLQLRSGQVLALLGANGAGKSTAVSVMLGLVQAEQGEASLLGQPPLSMDARRRTGVMLQSTALPDTLKVGGSPLRQTLRRAAAARAVRHGHLWTAAGVVPG